MKSLNLTNLTPSERVAKLNEAVATEAGPPYAQRNAAPGFTPAESVDAILPLILKLIGGEMMDWHIYNRDLAYETRTSPELTAAPERCIAYLRAKGWEVVT